MSRHKDVSSRSPRSTRIVSLFFFIVIPNTRNVSTRRARLAHFTAGAPFAERILFEIAHLQTLFEQRYRAARSRRACEKRAIREMKHPDLKELTSALSSRAIASLVLCYLVVPIALRYRENSRFLPLLPSPSCPPDVTSRIAPLGTAGKVSGLRWHSM